MLSSTVYIRRIQYWVGYLEWIMFFWRNGIAYRFERLNMHIKDQCRCEHISMYNIRRHFTSRNIVCTVKLVLIRPRNSGWHGYSPMMKWDSIQSIYHCLLDFADQFGLQTELKNRKFKGKTSKTNRNINRQKWRLQMLNRLKRRSLFIF